MQILSIVVPFFTLWSAHATRYKQSFLRSRNHNSRRLEVSEQPFIENNGLVIMEAESVPTVFPWVTETIRNGYRGDGYTHFTGNNIYGVGSESTTMSYYFQISNPGLYYMRIRAHKNVIEDSTLGNDCFTRMVDYDGVR